jgi:hypothetical protein
LENFPYSVQEGQPFAQLIIQIQKKQLFAVSKRNRDGYKCVHPLDFSNPGVRDITISLNLIKMPSASRPYQTKHSPSELDEYNSTPIQQAVRNK